MFGDLLARFDQRDTPPVEIWEIRDALVAMDCQDEIVLVPEEMNLDKLRGTCVQWKQRNAMYGEPKRASPIVYPSNAGVMLQRLICAKELVHVCDTVDTRTKEMDEIRELVQLLCGRYAFKSERTESMKFVADILAQGKAYMLLFPKAIRERARQKVSDGQLTIAELEKIAQIPAPTIEHLLDPEWDHVSRMLIQA